MRELDLCSIGSDHLSPAPAVSGNGNRRPKVAEDFFSGTFKAVRLVVCMPGGSDNARLRAYGEYLCNLLRGHIAFNPAEMAVPGPRTAQVNDHCDLLVFGEPEQSVMARILFGSAGRRLVRKTSTSILLARQPQWPIQRILLVLRVETSEESAVDWAGRLAHASGAHLTVLPLVSSQPLMYAAGSHLQVGIESLLTPNTPSGEQLRHLLDKLNEWQVDGTVKVRQGEPLWQICWEIAEENYELVIIGAEQHRDWRRWMFGELVGPLISRVNRPILIACARPPKAQRRGQGRINEQDTP